MSRHQLQHWLNELHHQGRPEKALDAALAAAHDAHTLAERRYASRAAKALAPRVPLAARTADRRSRIQALGLPWPDPSPEVGVSAFPTVGGSRENVQPDCFVEVRAARSSADTWPDSLAADSAAATQQALDAVRAHTGDPGGFAITFDGPDNFAGPSLGLAVALAALSAHRCVPVSAYLVASGQVLSTGRVVPVAALPAKLGLLGAARPRAQMLVAPGDAEDHPHCIAVATLAAAEAKALSSEPDAIDDTLAAVDQAVRQSRWPEAARLAATIDHHPHLESQERLRLLSVRLAAANHQGLLPQSEDLAHRLQAVVDQVGHAEAAVRALGHLAVSAVDRLAVDQALKLGHSAEAIMPLDAESCIHARGPLAMALTLSGDFEAALERRRHNVATARRHARAELPRCLGDLARAHLRLGHEDDALQAILGALDAARNSRRRRPYQDATVPFLHHHHARILASLGKREEARRAAEAAAHTPGLAPRVFAQLLLAELSGEVAAVDAVESALPAWVCQVPVIGALVLAARGRLGAARARVELSRQLGLAEGDFEEAARRLPY